MKIPHHDFFGLSSGKIKHTLTFRLVVILTCQQGAERKRIRLAEEEAWAGDEVEITDYGITLALVNYFKYLVRGLSVADDN